MRCLTDHQTHRDKVTLQQHMLFLCFHKHTFINRMQYKFKVRTFRTEDFFLFKNNFNTFYNFSVLSPY